MRLKSILMENILSKEEVLKWLSRVTDDELNPEDWTIEDEKVIFDPAKPMDLIFAIDTFKFPFGKFHGSLILSSLHGSRGKLVTLKNFPTEVTGDVDIDDQRLRSIDGKIKCKNLYMTNNHISSLKGIHEKVECEKLSIYNNPINDGVLDLLKIPNLKQLIVSAHPSAYKNNPCATPNKALKAIAEFVGKGSQGLVKAQRALIEADLEDYA